MTSQPSNQIKIYGCNVEVPYRFVCSFYGSPRSDFRLMMVALLQPYCDTSTLNVNQLYSNCVRMVVDVVSWKDTNFLEHLIKLYFQQRAEVMTARDENGNTRVFVVSVLYPGDREPEFEFKYNEPEPNGGEWQMDNIEDEILHWEQNDREEQEADRIFAAQLPTMEETFNDDDDEDTYNNYEDERAEFEKEAYAWHYAQLDEKREMQEKLSPKEFNAWKARQGPRTALEFKYEHYLKTGQLVGL